MAVGHTRVGDVHMAVGRVVKAQGAYEQALRIQEGLPGGAAASLSAQARRDVSVTYVKLADVYCVLPGRMAEAERLYERAYQVRRELAEGDAEDVQARRDLAVVCDKLGEVAARKGGAAEAVEWYSKAAAERGRLLRLQPTNRQWQSEQWAAEGKLGVAYAALARSPQASAEERRGAGRAAVAHLRLGLEQVEAQRKAGAGDGGGTELDAVVARFTQRIEEYQRTLGGGDSEAR
jgi:tetratricopeptide (TPR) repeat protein